MIKKQNPPVVPKVNVGDNERLYFAELNDANMATFNWQSSRYKGKQLFTTELNFVTASLISGSGSVAGVKYVGPISGGFTGSILVPDKTGYGKTACVQKYSRNIYLGNGVIGLDQGSEDESLLAFEGFSYAQTSTYFTVNDDDTITTKVLSNRRDNFDERRGFYRAFNEDFPETSKCTLIVLDESIKTNLKDNYNVYFNGGQLRKIVALNPTGSEVYDDDGVLTHVSTPGIYDIGASPSRRANWNLEYHRITASNDAYYNNNSVILHYNGSNQSQGGSRPVYFNINSDITFFYTGSLNEAFLQANADYEAITSPESWIGNISDAYINESSRPSDFLEFLQSADTFRSQSFVNKGYIDDKRFFVSLIKKGPSTAKSVPFPIRTLTSGSTPEDTGSLITNNLAELSTGEIYDIRGYNMSGEFEPSDPGDDEVLISIILRSGSILNQDYNSIKKDESDLGAGLFSHLDAFPTDFATGSLCITRCDNSNPSLLLNLPKNEHLKDGIGQRGYVILPENIHPHIKQNLRHYLFRAGIPLGIPVAPAPDNTFRVIM